MYTLPDTWIVVVKPFVVLNVRVEPWGRVIGTVSPDMQLRASAVRLDSRGEPWLSIYYSPDYPESYIYARYTLIYNLFPV